MGLDYNDKILVVNYDEQTGGGKQGALSRKELLEGLNVVGSTNDLPPADASGVIQLEDNATYQFTGVVDLMGSRLVAGQNTVILGSSSENCRIKSTGLTGTALLTSNWSIPIRGITFEADIALNLDAAGNANQAIDWFGVNFTDCGSVGTIKDYGNVIWTDCAVLNSGSLTFDGTIGTVGFLSSLFDASSGSTSIILPATLTITRRFRTIYSAFVTLSGETGINASTSATIPVEGYILDTVNFGGGGTYTTGITSDDNKALWINCRGITNSDTVGGMYVQNNSAVTNIVTQGVAVKVNAATTAAAVNQRFTHAANRLTYVGARERDFLVSVTATLVDGGVNNSYGIYIAKNGVAIAESEQYVQASGAGRVESVALQAIIPMTTDDYLEVFAENDTSTADVTFQFMNVIALPIV